jgi:hypothetical protein
VFTPLKKGGKKYKVYYAGKVLKEFSSVQGTAVEIKL